SCSQRYRCVALPQWTFPVELSLTVLANFPACFTVFEGMVFAAQMRQIRRTGDPTVFPGSDVVNIAAFGVHSASGKAAVTVTIQQVLPELSAHPVTTAPIIELGPGHRIGEHTSKTFCPRSEPACSNHIYWAVAVEVCHFG